MSDLAPDRNIGGNALRGVLGALPVVGPLVTEILGEVLPNYRMERLEACVRAIEEHLSDIDPVFLRKRMIERVFVDLLDDGLRAAARSGSEVRIRELARVVADGIKEGSVSMEQRRFLLRTLEEMNDAEVIHLIAKGLELRSSRRRPSRVLRETQSCARANAVDLRREPTRRGRARSNR
jgi:hypothetical protein